MEIIFSFIDFEFDIVTEEIIQPVTATVYTKNLKKTPLNQWRFS